MGVTFFEGDEAAGTWRVTAGARGSVVGASGQTGVERRIAERGMYALVPVLRRACYSVMQQAQELLSAPARSR